MDEIINQNARAVRKSVQVVTEVREGDLSRPTPCAGWTLADLLTHMTVQHNGFAAAAKGEGADLSHWQPGRLDRSRLVSEYTQAADRVLGAFAADGVIDREFCLPEIPIRPLFPARQAIGFHLVDYVAHGWDVARSIGLDYDADQDVLDAALIIARAVPDDDRRGKPGSAFARRIESASDKPLDRTLTLLGRDPAWRPA